MSAVGTTKLAFVTLLILTAVSVTPADADVKLVSDVMEEFCEVSLYCDFNVSDVAVVQLRVKSSSSSDWVTAYRLNANNNSESWHTEYQARANVNRTDSRATFSIKEMMSSDAGSYSCVVENASGQRWNDTVFINEMCRTDSSPLPSSTVSSTANTRRARPAVDSGDVPPTNSTVLKLTKSVGERLELVCSVNSTRQPIYLYWIFQPDETEAGTTVSQVGSNVTSVASAMATVATTTGSRVGNESYGLAVVFAESLTASGFDGLYTCLGHFNGTELPLYTILKYRLDVVSDGDGGTGEGDGQELQPWAIALIVIGCVLLIAGIVVIIVLCKLKCCCFTCFDCSCIKCCCCNDDNQVSPDAERQDNEAHARKNLPAGGRLPPISSYGNHMVRRHDPDTYKDDEDEDDDDDEDEDDGTARGRPRSAAQGRKLPPLALDADDSERPRRKIATSSS